MEALAMNRLGEKTLILDAELEEDAGIIGAATVAMRCVEGHQLPMEKDFKRRCMVVLRLMQ